MAAETKNLVLSNSSDANFRAWGKAISDQLATFGWVKTGDTGQINWTTVTAPTGTQQSRGYEIWRMNDALQATAPVFLKLEFGSGYTTTMGPGLWFTLGTASDGAGNLAGQVGTRTWHYMYDQASPTVAYRCIFSGDPGRLALCLAVDRDWSDLTLWVNIERSKDASGADTAAGVFRCGSSYFSSAAQFLPMTGTIPPQDPAAGCLTPSSGSGSIGQDVYLYPVIPFNARPLNPCRGVAGYFRADITQDSVFPVSIYGTTQTFYAVGHQVYGPMLRVSQNLQAVAIRYD